MTSFMQRSIKHLALIKAVREFRTEIEKAGLDNLKILADAGKSIVGTYLQGCSLQEKKRHKQELRTLVQWGITADMILTELARQMPEVGVIMEGKKRYREAELREIAEFLREG